MQEQWAAVDDYFNRLLAASDPILEAALLASEEAGLPPIQVAANQGKLLHLLAQMVGARSILEIGTLGGYSTIWLARALESGGRLITLEVNPDHAAVAQANFERAGLSDVIELRVGNALDSLAALEGPFDLVFIDADKVSTPTYFEWALKLTRSGSLIIIDNVVRGGAVADADSADPNVQGIQRALAMIAAESRVSATAIQTVGAKGYDGLAVVRVL